MEKNDVADSIWIDPFVKHNYGISNKYTVLEHLLLILLQICENLEPTF